MSTAESHTQRVLSTAFRRAAIRTLTYWGTCTVRFLANGIAYRVDNCAPDAETIAGVEQALRNTHLPVLESHDAVAVERRVVDDADTEIVTVEPTEQTYELRRQLWESYQQSTPRGDA